MNVIRTLLEAMAAAIEGREYAGSRRPVLSQRSPRTGTAAPPPRSQFRFVALRDLEGPRRRASWTAS